MNIPKCSVWFALLAYCLCINPPSILAQPGDQGGLFVQKLYNSQLQELPGSDSTLQIRCYKLEHRQGTWVAGKEITERDKAPFERYDATLKQIFLPPYRIGKKFPQPLPNQRMNICYNGDTMTLDIFGIVNSHGVGITQYMDSVVFQKGHVVVHRFPDTTKNMVWETLQKDKYQWKMLLRIQNHGITPHSLRYLAKINVLETNIRNELYTNQQQPCADTIHRAPQQGWPNVLFREDVIWRSDTIWLHTNSAPVKIDSFDCYKFMFNQCDMNEEMRSPYGYNLYDTVFLRFKSAIFMLNDQPYTGYLKIMFPFHHFYDYSNRNGGYDLHVYQFHEGILEREDILSDVDLVRELPQIRAEKPVLYLYPSDTASSPIDVTVKLQLTGHDITFSYPKYQDMWSMQVKPDGTLVDKSNGKEYYCLFWETQGNDMIVPANKGFLLKGAETASFLEEKLGMLGLNSREINEFIIYWLPKMEHNPYNAIYFADSEYEAISKLQIHPKPDQIIRVMMLWQGLAEPISLEPQLLPAAPKRTGFTAVEWGGTEVRHFHRQP